MVLFCFSRRDEQLCRLGSLSHSQSRAHRQHSQSFVYWRGSSDDWKLQHLSSNTFGLYPVQFLCSVASAAFGRAWYYSEEFLERPELSAMKLFRLEQYHLWLPSCPQTCWRPAAPGLPSAHLVSLLTLMGCVSMKQLTAATCPLFLALFISPRGN